MESSRQPWPDNFFAAAREKPLNDAKVFSKLVSSILFYTFLVRFLDSILVARDTTTYISEINRFNRDIIFLFPSQSKRENIFPKDNQRFAVMLYFSKEETERMKS